MDRKDFNFGSVYTNGALEASVSLGLDGFVVEKFINGRLIERRNIKIESIAQDMAENFVLGADEHVAETRKFLAE